jgi:adenylylsulfate kinase
MKNFMRNNPTVFSKHFVNLDVSVSAAPFHANLPNNGCRDQNQKAPGAALTWWFSGLPGAGKTTLAQALAQALRGQGQAVCVLDGDALRQGLSSDLGFSERDRHEQSRRTAEIAHLLNASQINAIVALVSPTRQSRQAAREIVGQGRFIEVFVSTPLAVCQQRDPKGLYKRAASHEALGLTGVQSPYETPNAAEFTIDTSQTSVAQAMALLAPSFSSSLFSAPHGPSIATSSTF